MRKIALVLAVLLVSGCALWSSQGPSAQMLEVKIATLEVLDNDKEKAATWVSWVDDGIRFIESENEAKISALDVALRKRIDWNALEPSESLLIDAVILEIRMRLINKFGDDLLTGEQRIKLVQVLQWSKEAAQTIR